MGCSTVHAASIDGQPILSLKSEPLTQFFKNCASYGFTEVYVPFKITHNISYEKPLSILILISTVYAIGY
jgi:hypothetical protein